MVIKLRELDSKMTIRFDKSPTLFSFWLYPRPHSQEIPRHETFLIILPRQPPLALTLSSSLSFLQNSEQITLFKADLIRPSNPRFAATVIIIQRIHMTLLYLAHFLLYT